MFNQDIAQQLVQKLQTVGVETAAGLTDVELENIETLLGAKLPPDLRIFLSCAVPVSINGDKRFPQWKSDPAGVIKESQERVEAAFLGDIENNEYWSELFGDKPENLAEAKEQCLTVIRSWPPLVRVYAHRYMPTEPSDFGNPVLSVWQAVDTIYYGFDLADYLSREFKLEPLLPVPSEPRHIPYWTQAFGLEND